MDNNILPVWQPTGYSTHIIAKNIAKKYNKKTAHTGTLDPMAEGVVIVLLGAERLKKKEYAVWRKEYEFEMILGISTDTLDGLGLITKNALGKKFDSDSIKKDELEALLKKFVGKYKQKYPEFSAKKILGKPLHWYSREGKLSDITIPTKEGEIYSLQLLGIEDIELGAVVKDIRSRVKRITGDLRQDEIVKSWEDLLNKQSSFTVVQKIKFRVEMSKGLYVRGLARDIAQHLGMPAFVYTIKRTKNGKYSKNDCATLEEIFGSNFMDEYSFVSRGKS